MGWCALRGEDCVDAMLREDILEVPQHLLSILRSLYLYSTLKEQLTMSLMSLWM